jgi:hypothetical protein
MIKLTTIFYYDLQQQTIDSSSLALPFDDTKLDKEKTISNSIQLSTSSLIINRTQIEYYRQYVQRKNREQFMYNSYLFSSEKTRYILLVQVHTRVIYLKKFIEMLQDVETINQTLVIFSHDFIDPEINILVKNINFVPVRKFYKKFYLIKIFDFDKIKYLLSSNRHKYVYVVLYYRLLEDIEFLCA